MIMSDASLVRAFEKQAPRPLYIAIISASVGSTPSVDRKALRCNLYLGLWMTYPPPALSPRSHKPSVYRWMSWLAGCSCWFDLIWVGFCSVVSASDDLGRRLAVCISRVRPLPYALYLIGCLESSVWMQRVCRSRCPARKIETGGMPASRCKTGVGVVR